MKEVFPITSPGISSLLFIVPVAAILIGVLVLLLSIGVNMRRGTVELSKDGLHLRVPFYGRIIPRSSLVSEEARAVNLKQERELGLKWRTNGIGMPGYCVGWFRLQGGQKALAAVTDPQRVAFIPTRDGYSVLVSVPEPQSLVDSLKRSAPSSTESTH